MHTYLPGSKLQGKRDTILKVSHHPGGGGVLLPEKVEDLPSLQPRDLALRIRGQFWESNQMQIPPTITLLRLRSD